MTVHYPYYMFQKRKNLTAAEMEKTDCIRQRLIRLAHTDGYGVKFYTDGQGREMASICRTDGQGVGFRLTAAQAREWLNT